MSCIELNISQIGDGLNASSSRIGNGIITEVRKIGSDLQVEMREIGKRLAAQTSRILDGITVRCSIICSLKDVGYYLDISPEEIQWITDDMGVFYDVESNVEWKIIID